MIGDAKIPVECDSCGEEELRDMTPLTRGSWDDRNVIRGLIKDGWLVNEETGQTTCPDCRGDA